MRVLILCGTTEGQTRKIAEFVADLLMAQGHEVSLLNALQQPAGLHVGGYDAAIIAARVHAGQYQRQVADFVRKNRAALDALPSAFLSVSMSAANLRPGDLERAKGYVEALVRNTGWTPGQTLHVGGARLYNHHGRIGRWILGLVDGHRFDTSKDHVWTDWSALERFAAGFLAGPSGRDQAQVVWSTTL